MNTLNRWRGRWTVAKAFLLLLLIACLSALGEMDTFDRRIGAGICGVMGASVLIPQIQSALRQRQKITCRPGGMELRDFWGREYTVWARDLGGITVTKWDLRLFDREGKRLCSPARQTRLRETAGLDVLLALLTPGKGLHWDGGPFVLRRPLARRIWTALSALFLELLVVFWGVFWQVTGQMRRELLESWGVLGALSALWSIWRCCKAFRPSIRGDRKGIVYVSAFGRKRAFSWEDLELDWERDGIPKLPGLELTGWDKTLWKLLCALRDNGLLTDEWEEYDDV